MYLEEEPILFTSAYIDFNELHLVILPVISSSLITNTRCQFGSQLDLTTKHEKPREVLNMPGTRSG